MSSLQRFKQGQTVHKTATERHTDKHSDSYTGIQTSRQRNSHTKTNGQTDKQTHITRKQLRDGSKKRSNFKIRGRQYTQKCRAKMLY